MQAKDYALNVVLQERQQWAIPVYQRTYAWETGIDKQLPKLWDDLHDCALERLDGFKPKPHFVGAIIYTQPQDQPFGTVNRRYLVDGQQRITTFNLVLCALRECARDQSCDRLISTINEYLFNAKSASMADPNREQFKLWPSSYDRPFYSVLAQESAEGVRKTFSDFFFQNGKLIWGQAPKVLAAYWYLREKISDFVTEKKIEAISPELALDAILSGFLSGFQIVVVQLGQEDDAQAIFASLNGNAQPLTSFDLIRNDIFHRARKANEDDDALYNNYWNDLETDFWKKEVKQGRLKRPRTDHLITHALVAETGQDVNVGQVSNEYRRFSEKRAFESVAEEVKSLLRYARAYEEMERRQKGQALARVASFLDVWDMSAFHPIVLWTSVQDIAQEDKNEIYAFVESYLIRRDICDLTNKNYNKVVPALLRDIHTASDARAAFFKHTTELAGDVSRIPVDAEVVTSIVKKPLYQQLGSRKLRYIFSKIEQHLRSKYDEKVSVAVDDLTVEHIMPSAWAKNWPLQSGATVGSEIYFSLTALGIEVGEVVRREMEVREAAKHTLGNLTMLTHSLNPALGNSGWLYKKGLIAKSLLVINRSVAEHDDWNEDAIEARSVKLALTINEIWPYPGEFKKAG